MTRPEPPRSWGYLSLYLIAWAGLVGWMMWPAVAAGVRGVLR